MNLHVWMDGYRQTCMYVCMHGWMEIGKTVCMYVCMYVCVNMYIHAYSM